MKASGCILCGNRFISPIRSCAITGLQCDGCFAVAEIDKQIEETQEKLRSLIHSRQDALTRANESHDPFICRFPAEIAGNVFRFCLPERPHLSDDLEKPDPQSHAYTLPGALRTLTTLCKSWNRIACTMPDLWQTLFARHPHDLYDIDNYLQRSGDLSITIDLKLDTWYWSARQREEVIKSICKYANRWNFLRVQAPHDVITTIAGYTYRLNDGAPRLSFLILRALPPRSGPKPPDCSFSIGAPNSPLSSLIHISLQGVKISKTTFNLSRLTTLELTSISISFFLEVLQRSPLLTSANVRFVAGIRFLFPPGKPRLITHTALKALKVVVFEIGVEGLFESISLPSLEKLDFTAQQHLRSCECPQLRNCLIRSQCILKNLKLSVSCSEIELVDILLVVPEILHISLEKTQLSSQFFQRIGQPVDLTTIGGIANTFLPLLRSLEFYASQVSYDSFDWSLLNGMVPKNRTRSNFRPLSRVTVHMTEEYQWKMTRNDELVVEDVIDSGIEVSVICRGEERLWSRDRLQAALGRLREKKASWRG